MISPEFAVSIFQKSISEWHKKEAPATNPYGEQTIEFLLFQKNHVDTIQWHIEDDIRVPGLKGEEIYQMKKRIDTLNQQRTDLVEKIDDLFWQNLGSKQNLSAPLNSETPAWLLDRMSILELKIYHMKEQTERKDASEAHIATCKNKLQILTEQRTDLSTCFQELLDGIQKGTRRFKLYRQMKMYNDESTNPSLYKKK